MANQLKTKRQRVSDRLRTAVQSSEHSPYRICKLAGIDPAAMSRFLAGSGLNLESIDRLCDVLGLELVSSNVPKQTRKGAK